MIVETNSKESGMRFNTSEAKLAFAKLKQTFSIAPIIHHFDLECHIGIKTDEYGYVINGVFSQLTLVNSVRWHMIALFSQKIILAKT